MEERTASLHPLPGDEHDLRVARVLRVGGAGTDVPALTANGQTGIGVRRDGSVAAAARRLDPEHVAGAEVTRSERGQLLPVRRGCARPHPARRRRRPRGPCERRCVSSESRQARGPQLAHDAVTAAEDARATRAEPQRVALHAKWDTPARAPRSACCSVFDIATCTAGRPVGASGQAPWPPPIVS